MIQLTITPLEVYVDKKGYFHKTPEAQAKADLWTEIKDLVESEFGFDNLTDCEHPYASIADFLFAYVQGNEAVNNAMKDIFALHAEYLRLIGPISES